MLYRGPRICGEVLFASVIEACVRIGQLDLLSAKLQQYAAKGGLAGLTAPTYGSMIKAYGRARDIDPRLVDGLIRFEQLRRENRQAEEAAGRANSLDYIPAPPRELPSSTLPVASQPQAPQPFAGVAHSLGEQRAAR